MGFELQRHTPTVLVVDDAEAARYANARLLRNAGFAVREARTGQDALDLARSADVVLLDIKLPDMSGLEVCRRLKADPATAALPVLHLTATYGAGEDQAAALEAGADGYLTHPVEPIVLVATVRSLIRAREAEAQARRVTTWWQTTFDAIGDGVALLDRKGSVLRCNRAMATWFDCAPGEAAGNASLPPFPGVASAPPAWPVPRALETRQRASAEIDMGGRWAEVVADPAFDEDATVAAVVLTVKDVTERKRSQEQMAELLAREQAARHEAEQLNRIKDEFLATVSHELRTPLNAIVGWVHLLRTGQLDAASTAQAIETIARNAQLQGQLVADILDVSRIVAGKLRVERRVVDLSDVIREALETVRPAAESKKITIDAHLEPAARWFKGDPDRLQQVVWNLLSNAIKFTPQGGRVMVELGFVDSSIRILVEDNGPGIAPSFLPHVFDRFRQADATTTRPHGGLGLGLAIVRHLVELHGGTVTARNKATDSGAVFEVILPRPDIRPGEVALARSTSAEPDEQTPAGGVDLPLKGTRVLVVDDDADARALLRFILTRAGAIVSAASTAAEGSRRLRSERPHVLVADIEMPGEDGYSLISSIRSLSPSEGGTTPAAALTAYAGNRDRARVLESGFQAHIPKPVLPSELIAIVAALRSEDVPEADQPERGIS
jgi:signal transduction histidine kinase/DNA-binding response OmpR family regulator